MKTFMGNRAGERMIVVMTDSGGVGSILKPSRSSVAEAQGSTFDWGTNNDGTRLLAFTLLAQVIGDQVSKDRVSQEAVEVVASRYLQMFTGEFVSTWADNWKISADTITGWLRKVAAEADTKRLHYSLEPQFPKHTGEL